MNLVFLFLASIKKICKIKHEIYRFIMYINILIFILRKIIKIGYQSLKHLGCTVSVTIVIFFVKCEIYA